MVKLYEAQNLYEVNSSLKVRKIIIYGCSYSGVMLYYELIKNNVQVAGFIDSFEQKEKEFCGKPIISMKTLQQMDKTETAVAIATRNHKYQMEILDILEENSIKNIYVQDILYGAGKYDTIIMKDMIQINREKISFVYNNLKDETSEQIFMNLIAYRLTNDSKYLELSHEKKHSQYFPETDIMEFSNDEVFVDAGAFNGNTFLEFIDKVGGQDNFRRIYSFEPDEQMFIITKEVAKLQKKHELIEVYPYALYDKKSIMSFNKDSDTGSSAVQTDGAYQVETIALDELLSDRKEQVTYIKMDIEGSEVKALDGAKRIISEDHPKLAISIYHNIDDLWEIPYKILKEYQGYRIHIRHYTDITTETICYGVYTKIQ